MPELSITIPAYNEEKRLGKTLAELKQWIASQPFSIELIVVDDGSRDGTVGLVESFMAANPEMPLRVIANKVNGGKGSAVRTGVLASVGEWVLFSDADLSTPIEEYFKLRAEADRGGAAVVIGSRAKDRSLVGKHQSVAREAAGRFFNLLMRTWTGLKVQDTQCGFKLMRGDVGRRIFGVQRLNGFSFDVEMLVIAQENGFGIAEVPVRWFNVEDSKVTLASGLKSFADLREIWVNRQNGLYRFR